MKKVKWTQLFFSVLWLLAAILIFVLFQTGSLSGSIPIPRFISWAYDLFGVTVASVIQIVLCIFSIVDSFRNKESSNAQ